MKKSPTLFLSILFLSFFPIKNLYAQTTQKDSLSKYSFEELHDKSYAAKPDSLKALLYANYHLKRALEKKDTLNIGLSYYILSSNTNDTLSFISYWRKIFKSNKTSTKLKIIGNLNLGDFYFHKGKKHQALNNYLLAQKYITKNSNDSLNAFIYSRLGVIKSKNKKYHEALELLRKSMSLRNFKKLNLNEYYSLLINISYVHNKLKQYDSAFFYNNKLISISKKQNDSVMMGYGISSKGRIEFNRKKYKSAINNLKESIPFIIQDENFQILSGIYLQLAKSHFKLGYENKSLQYYLKIDSIFFTKKNYYSSQKPAYKFLANYYKEKKDDKKQLEYIKKYITIDSVLNTRIKGINKSLNDNYDIPNLLAEKELIEKRLQQEVSTTYKWSLGITSLAVVLLLFLIQQSSKRKRYKKRFQQLIANSNQKTTKNETTVVKKEQTVSDAVLESITKHLALFEKNKEFLSTEITLSYLAKTFETNSKYLSQVINQQKEQSFNNYINGLRIKYTVEKLKTDLIFRKYSIKAIANDVGFNTTESFSKAFYKNTGIRPSFFIKELEKK